MKFHRQFKILELIEGYEIETQEDLQAKLKLNGFDVTQATVSRDIKELRLVKTLTNEGKYKYASSVREQSGNVSTKFRVIFKESVTRVDSSGNIAVIKTLSGMAQAAAAAIDAMSWIDVVGSLAGDDTIFVILRSGESAVEFTQELNKMLK